MIGDYLNQSATWKQRTGFDGYGKPTFAADQTISVRLEYKSKLIRSVEGHLVVAQGTIFTDKAVEAQDVLVIQGHSYHIQGVGSEVPDLDGTEIFREVYF